VAASTDRALSLIHVFVILAGMVPRATCVRMDGVLLRSCAQLPPVRQAASTEDVIILANATAILVTVAQPVLLKPLQVESIHAAFLTLPRLAIWLMASYYMTALLDIRELPQKHALTFLASTAISVARPAVTAGLELTA